jgi:PAS domain S-box-containing protein
MASFVGFAKCSEGCYRHGNGPRRSRTSFFQLCVEMLAVAGFDGRLRRVSRNWTNVLGWSEDELIGQPWLDFVHPEDVEPLLWPKQQRVLQGHDVVSFQNRLRTSSGEYRWISWKGSSNPEQQLIYAAGTDITDSRKAEFEREKMLEERAHRAAELDAILRSMPDAVYVGDENGIRECNQVA